MFHSSCNETGRSQESVSYSPGWVTVTIKGGGQALFVLVHIRPSQYTFSRWSHCSRFLFLTILINSFVGTWWSPLAFEPITPASLDDRWACRVLSELLRYTCSHWAGKGGFKSNHKMVMAEVARCDIYLAENVWKHTYVTADFVLIGSPLSSLLCVCCSHPTTRRTDTEIYNGTHSLCVISFIDFQPWHDPIIIITPEIDYVLIKRSERGWVEKKASLKGQILIHFMKWWSWLGASMEEWVC